MDKGKNDQNPTKDSPVITSEQQRQLTAAGTGHSGVAHPPITLVKTERSPEGARREASVPCNQDELESARQALHLSTGRNSDGSSKPIAGGNAGVPTKSHSAADKAKAAGKKNGKK